MAELQLAEIKKKLEEIVTKTEQLKLICKPEPPGEQENIPDSEPLPAPDPAPFPEPNPAAAAAAAPSPAGDFTVFEDDLIKRRPKVSSGRKPRSKQTCLVKSKSSSRKRRPLAPVV